jgi:tetratricopeptide (TPR) repeat protein
VNVPRPRPRTLWPLPCVAAVLLATLAPIEALAAPADDWSLEHKSDDPALVSQRMTKLRKNPFDGSQWRALQRAIGTKALAQRVAGLLEKKPTDTALRILDARAQWAQGDPSGAAKKLAALHGKAGRWEDDVLMLRIEMLEAAAEPTAAIAALETAAAGAGDKTATKLLSRAYDIAEGADLGSKGLELARALAKRSTDQSARLRLARAATRAGETDEADRTYADAITHAKGREADELVAERARARLEGDNAAGASKLLWGLLDTPGHGAESVRAGWWDLLAEAHRRDGSTEVLVARLSKWLADHDGDAAGWRTLAQAQETAGLDATKAWRKVLDLQPRDAESHGELIDALDQKGDTSAAREEYARMVDRHPHEVELGLELAARMIAAGQREEALRLAGDIERRVGKRSRELMLLLDFYNLQDEPDRALVVAQRIVKLGPRKLEARVALGEQLYQMGRVTEALEQWGTIPGLVRPPHAGYAKHAEILSEHGRTAEAAVSLKKALKLAPAEPRYLRLRAMLAEDQRRPQMALELWEQVRKLARSESEKLLRDEARTRVVELLVGGTIPRRRAQLEGAEGEARAVLDKGEPLADAVEAGRFLSELYTRQENYPSAVQVQHQLLELSPDDPTRLSDLATAQRRAGQVQSAMGTLEELLQAEPGRSADVLAEMSELAFEAGDAKGALDAASRAAGKDRTQVEALIRLGQMHERQGDMDEARRAYEEALDVVPGDARARLRIAELELTEGKDEKAAETLRSVLDDGGPPELMREAGRRALDLAEASGDTMDLFAVALDRTSKHPEADEPRELLLDALDRVDHEKARAWIREGKDPTAREAALRGPLVAALTRGSVGARLRAAEHLGWLGLPKTAAALAKMGASLSAPRDSTATVRDAFERTRIAAIRAAGTLRDPESVDVLRQIVDDGGQTAPARHAAGWALAQTEDGAAAEALAGELKFQNDPLLSSLACIALAHRPRKEVSADVRASIDNASRYGRSEQVRHTCAFAAAALRADDDLDGYVKQVRSSDPMLAAIAAWRLGRMRTGSDEAIEALLTRYVGPGGLARDASAAALSRLLGKPDANAEIAAVPAPPRGSGWTKVVDRWLESELAPEPTVLTAEALASHRQRLAAALDAASAGTRAERQSAAEVVEGCASPPGAPAGRHACLAPLVDGPVALPVRD